MAATPSLVSTSFYFVRHGETDHNRLGLVQGHAQIPLNASGEEQAKDLAKRIASLKFDFCYSSDLIRAQRTAQILTEKRAITVLEDKRLRERDLGKQNEGKSISAYLFYKHTTNGKGIETDDEMSRRIKAFMEETKEKYPNSNILVVTHGGLIKRLLIDLNKSRFIDAMITNAALLHLKAFQGTYTIMSMDGIKN